MCTSTMVISIVFATTMKFWLTLVRVIIKVVSYATLTGDALHTLTVRQFCRCPQYCESPARRKPACVMKSFCDL